MCKEAFQPTLIKNQNVQMSEPTLYKKEVGHTAPAASPELRSVPELILQLNYLNYLLNYERYLK